MVEVEAVAIVRVGTVQKVSDEMVAIAEKSKVGCKRWKGMAEAPGIGLTEKHDSLE